jgi:hypothetical protein
MKSITILILTLISLNSMGSTYYVATNGNDSSSTGSISAPYLTVPRGLRQLRAGDTLYIRGGTYNVPGTYGNAAADTWGCVPTCPTSWAGATKVMNYPGEQVILNHNGFNFYATRSSGGAAYFIWQTSPGDPRSNFIHQQYGTTQSGAFLIALSHHIRLQGMTIRNFKDHGVLTGCEDQTKKLSFFEFIDNLVENNGDNSYLTDHEHGIYISCGTDILITKNHFLNNWAFGIHGNAHESTDNHRWTITQNLIEGRSGPSIGTAACIWVEGGSNHLVANNVCIGKGRASNKLQVGISIGYFVGTAFVVNNTIYDVATAIQFLRGPTNVAKNNLMNLITRLNFEDLGGNTKSDNLCTTGEAGCKVVTTNAGFANTSTLPYNLHLTSGSPAIDRGVSITLPFNDYFGRNTVSTDFDGAARTGVIDIGAYEFGSGTPSPTKPKPPINLKVQ